MFGFDLLDNIIEVGHNYDPNIKGKYICILSENNKNHVAIIAEMFSECENVTNSEHFQGRQTVGYHDNLVIKAVYIENTYGNPIRIEVIELQENGVNDVTLDEYVQKMVNHDHYYEYADDHRSWSAGSASDGWLKSRADEFSYLPFETRKNYFGQFVNKEIYAPYISRIFSKSELSTF